MGDMSANAKLKKPNIIQTYWLTNGLKVNTYYFFIEK